MRKILATQLIIPENRQRRNFDEKALLLLKASILSKGLLHPIVVRQIASERYFLVAGERRLRALTLIAQEEVTILCNDTHIAPGWLPVTLLSDLDELAIREAELEENTVRADLSWQEQAAAYAALAELRGEQKAQIGEKQTVTATASEILGRPAEGGQVTAISEALLLARHLNNPNIATAKTQKEALKILKKEAEQQHRAVLAQKFDQSKTTHILKHEDAFNLSFLRPETAFACIITDPPYGVGADTFGDQNKVSHQYSDTPEYARKCCELIAKEGFRLTLPSAHCYFFLDIRNFFDFSLIFKLHGWDVWPTPLIWSKQSGMLPEPEYGPRRTYEAILFANKGKRKVLRVAPDVLTHQQVSERDHGAQKPVDLFIDLLSRSCYPGEHILDPFAGSGTVFPAATNLKLIATGYENVETSYHIALSRLNEIVSTPEATLSTILGQLSK